MSFNDLPNEIIATIFHTHVHVHLGLRKTLLLTCRRWHAIATNLSSLWRNISWCTTEVAPWRTVRFHSLTGLARIIKRTGQATFELTLGHWHGPPSYEEIEDFVGSVDSNWLSRCYTINPSNTWMYDDKIHLLKRIFLGSTFDTLEGFVWNHPFYSATEPNLITLLHHFDISAPLLCDLTLNCVPNFPLHFPALLGRIRKFKNTEGLPSPSILSKLINIEHLDITRQSGPCSDFVAPRLTSLCLEGRFPPTTLPPRETLQKLAPLVLRFFGTGEYENHTSFSLPSLKYLGIQFGGYESFRGVINAENLEELALADLLVNGPQRILLGMNTAPRIVQLYLQPFTTFEVGLQPPSVWEKMEEFHLTVFGATVHIPSTVARALATAKFAPLLRCFTVRYANTDATGDPSQAQKQIWVQGLNDIMYNRVLAGMARPKELKVGWLPVCPDGPNLGQDCEKWVTEWIDCS